MSKDGAGKKSKASIYEFIVAPSSKIKKNWYDVTCLLYTYVYVCMHVYMSCILVQQY